jgi:tryptophan synthase alpha chain
MGRIGERFAALRARGERALIPFLTAGDPDLATTHSLVLALVQAGADLVEIGIPFSDPLGDGPVIQRANERALRAGTSLRRVLELVKTLRPQVEVPLVLMGYTNPILAMGERNFAEAAASVGVDGVIVIDLPPEEARRCSGAGRSRRRRGPAGGSHDPAAAAGHARGPGGFSITFRSSRRDRRAQPARARDRGSVRAVRALSDVPVCVGFGVSTPEQVREVGRFADGVAVGSALIETIQRAGPGSAAIDAAARFVAELKAPLRAPASA